MMFGGRTKVCKVHTFWRSRGGKKKLHIVLFLFFLYLSLSHSSLSLPLSLQHGRVDDVFSINLRDFTWSSRFEEGNIQVDSTVSLLSVFYSFLFSVLPLFLLFLLRLLLYFIYMLLFLLFLTNIRISGLIFIIYLSHIPV